VLPSFFVLVAVAFIVAVATAYEITSCVSSLVCYPTLVMRLSYASSVVLLNCLPLLWFSKKKR
jgi:hypothetical protein